MKIVWFQLDFNFSNESNLTFWPGINKKLDIIFVCLLPVLVVTVLVSLSVGIDLAWSGFCKAEVDNEFLVSVDLMDVASVGVSTAESKM